MNITAKELLEYALQMDKEVDEQVKADEQYFHLKNSVLKEALTVSVNLHLRWVRKQAEVNISLKSAKQQKDEAFSKALRDVKKDSHIDYGSTEAKIIAEANQSYIDFLIAYNKLSVLSDEVKGILDVVNSRRWILKNLVDLVVADGEGVIL